MKEEEEKEITLQDQGSELVELEPLQVTIWFNENSYLSSVEPCQPYGSTTKPIKPYKSATF